MLMTIKCRLLFTLLILTLFFSCKQKGEPIKIGLSLTLTGYHSPSQLEARDAIIMKVEEINRGGGINGRELELVIKDNSSDAKIAELVTKELIDEGVTAIIGNSSSFLSQAALKGIAGSKILLISTGAISSRFSGIDDQLIRIAPPTDKRAPYYAKLLFERLQAPRTVVIYDTFNLNYTEATFKMFQSEFEKLGGKIPATVTYNSKGEFDAERLAKEILKHNPQGIYIIGNALSAALLCQHIRKLDQEVKIVESEWGFSSQDFVNTGGPTVEGVASISSFDYNSQDEHFINFKKKYEERFNIKVTGYSTIAYETITVLAEGLKVTTDPAKLKDTIIKQRVFQGLDGKIIIDKYGDPLRTIYYSRIENGEIIATEKITASVD